LLRQTWIDYADEMSGKSKAYRKFSNALKTQSTKSTYSYNMKRFMKFLVGINEIKSDDVYDDVAKFGSEKITDALEEFVAELNKKLKKSAINTMLAGPELFFEMNRKICPKNLFNLHLIRIVNETKVNLISRIDKGPNHYAHLC